MKPWEAWRAADHMLARQIRQEQIRQERTQRQARPLNPHDELEREPWQSWESEWREEGRRSARGLGVALLAVVALAVVVAALVWGWLS